MTRIAKITLALLFGLTAAGAAFAADFTKGTIRKIDDKTGKVTIAHEELKNLDMPAMTMVFRMADESLLEKLKEGDVIEFVADRIDGKLTVVEVKE